MKFVAWFAAGVVACALGVWIFFPQAPVSSEAPGQQHADEFDVEGMFVAGLRAVANKDLARGDFLTQMALRRQVEQPQATATVWNKFRDYLDAQNLSPADRLARLTIYRDSIDTTLMACRTRVDFEEVWGVRQKVLAAIEEVYDQVSSEVAHAMTAFGQKIPELPSVAALEAFARLQTELESRLAVLLEAPPEDASTKGMDLSAVLHPVSALVAIAVAEGSRLSQEADTLAAQSVEEGKVEAAADGAMGQSEKLLRSVQELSRALERTRLSHWLVIAKDEAAQRELDNLNRDLTPLQGKLARLQQLRCNLWAVRQIYAAETVNDWDRYLGVIDTSLLHPTTAALYASAYESRIKKVDDPRIRTRTVQQLLNQKKTLLTAF
jgi:hypothetical protein